MLLDSDTFNNRGVGGNIDVGSGTTPNGQASVSSGTWTVIAGGGDIWTTNDQFHLVSSPQSGDYTQSCQILTQTNTNGFAKAGIMFRNDNNVSSVYYAVYVTPSNGIIVQARTATGANAIGVGGTVAYGGLPYYLKVARVGNTFTASTSPDGSTWTVFPSSATTIPAANTSMLVGLAVCSHNNGTACTVTASTFSPTLTASPTNTWSTASDGTAWSNNYVNSSLGVNYAEGCIFGNAADNVLQLGSKTAKDQEVIARMQITSTSDKAGVVARLTGSGSTNSYYRLAWYGGNLNLDKSISGTVTALATAVVKTMTPNTTYYWLKLRCTGTSIQGRFWQDGTTEPTTWTISATDSTQTQGGYGLYGNPSSNYPITFDSFVAQDGFVTRSGSSLVYNGTTGWRFSGGNCYWMGLQEVPNVSYPTNAQIDDALATLVEMGATAVRVHTLGISVGTALSVEPTHNTYNAAAFASMDYALKRIGDYGLKAIIPLVDNWAYYHGGKHHYTDFLSKANNPTVFYTDATTIRDFEAYINQIITRVNSLTGVPYYADSTILCWETGNELSYWPAGSPSYPDTTWTTAIAAYIKTLDTNHLIMAGTGSPNSADYSIANIDICTAHFYPLNVANLTTYASAVSTGGKCFIVGEYDWCGQFGGDTLASFLSSIEGNATIDGDLFWGLYGHADTGTGGFNEYAHDYTLYYPGENPTRAAIVQQLRTHMYKMQGINTPPAAGTPGAPVLLAVNKLGGPYVQPVWRGVPIAASYNVEKSTTGPSGTFNTVASGVTDWQLPLIIAGIPGGQSWWRVKAANTAGVFGAYSNVIQVSLP